MARRLLGLTELTEKDFPHVLALFFTDKHSSSADLQPAAGGENHDQDFLTRLIDFHREMKERKKSFEVIQIFLEGNSRKQSTPFLSIQHGQHSRVIQDYLAHKYGVTNTNGPTLILIDGTSGSVINFQGKENLLLDPKGDNFPWSYPNCSDLLESGHLIKNDSSSTTNYQLISASQHLKGTIKGFYFAAYWCPPCRSFLQLLNEVYKKIKSEHTQKFEIIFVSSDRSKESFDKFFSNQPWIAIPFEDVSRKSQLTAMYNVKGIPAFVIVDKNDSVITLDGRTEVVDDDEVIDFPWYPKLLEDLRDRHSSVLNHQLCIVYFTGSDGQDYDRAEDFLNPIAAEYANKDEVEALRPKFFIATDSELSESLRIFMDLEESRSYLVAIQSSRYATVGHLMTRKQIKEFIHRFQTWSPELNYKYFPTKFI